MTGLLKHMLVLSVLISTPIAAFGQATDTSKIMLFGVFHFANPGHDKVKTEQIDVMTEENQAYLEGLAARIAAFKPTNVLIECEPAASGKYQVKFQGYLEGEELPGSNENYQLGFRVAKLAGLAGVTCYDASFDWKAEALFDYMTTHDKAVKQQFDNEIARFTELMTYNHQHLSLKELLAFSNSPELDRENKNLYLMTNAVGAGDGFEGADASASWWQRNFRMYANIQKVAVPGTRVVVFGGQGHTAILKDFLAIDMQRKAEPVIPYL